ncbi:MULTISPECIES: DNA mismatch repair endonuclease MutL [Allobacillus]|uniref:DNA mismatch repair protein MutL n=1 Tax=Allobacillus salarius TaxID=1955272 RepID=A0A556PS61_9BACI|nr:DNA mismatch repair endonuclease MutL [Allobacillus salarius]TSJ67227.1 DNA mismatch repair endonuclease MutL [Allobacillus salarius]
MNKIVQLPDELSNKIAAGEVVERPSSVVKELIENSIDAGSSWIKIELDEAGLRLIRVTDDGEGMTAEDTEKAFFRHATSKIQNEQQLFRVKTLGFRGEALASIASVSHLTIRTSTGDQSGTEMRIHGGEIIEKQKHTKRRGTEITVENLFYNTPARLKYLKTVHTEIGHIMDLVNRMALAHDEIRFECHHNGKRIFFSPGNKKLLQVIQQIYGKNVAQQMLSLEEESLDYTIRGYVAKPEVTRSNRSYMTLIVNGRYIKNYTINKAILEGYHTLLPIGRFPVVVLKIDMDPYLIDVNVHPAKTEVRFSKEKELFDVVKQAVYNLMHAQRLIPDVSKKEKEKSEQTALDFSYVKRNEPVLDQRNNFPASETNNSNVNNASQLFEQSSNEVPVQQVEEPSITDVEMPTTEEGQIHETEEQVSTRLPRLYPIGQLRGTYILAQNEEGLYMVDQHAAQERIKYEFYKEKLGNPEQETQQLAVPLHFEFTNQEAITIEQHQEQLQAIGLYLEPFGSQSFLVRSYPSWFPAGEEEGILRDMVDELINEKTIDLVKIREEAAILMSCKRSIKANHYLSHQEMEYLLEELGGCNDPFTCPHGRPVIVHFSDYEIQRMFKRIM